MASFLLFRNIILFITWEKDQREARIKSGEPAFRQSTLPTKRQYCFVCFQSANTHIPLTSAQTPLQTRVAVWHRSDPWDACWSLLKVRVTFLLSWGSCHLPLLSAPLLSTWNRNSMLTGYLGYWQLCGCSPTLHCLPLDCLLRNRDSIWLSHLVGFLWQATQYRFK